MRTLKKTLCLVLALVMVLGLCAVNAVAAYSDAAKINYTEAVDVMSAIGVLQGDERGFRPQDTLTRAEASKIIAYMVGADDLTAKCSFKDVPADHWANSYIAYCEAEGIIAGYGDGNFGPSDTLTGSQFAKMLLCVLGYVPANEGITGDAWEVVVAKLVKSTGLALGMAKFDGTKPITREEAALLGLNTLTSDMVEYDSNGVNITIGGTSINTGASKAKPVSRTTGTDYAGAAEDADGTLQFCEEYFSKLTFVAAGVKTAEGLNGYKWQYKGKDCSEVVDINVPLATYAKSAPLPTYANVISAAHPAYIGCAADTDGVSYLLNGSASTSAGVAAAAGNYGTVVTFYDTDYDGTYNVVSAVAKSVTTLAAAPATKKNAAGKDVVTISTLGLYDVLTSTVDGFEGLAKYDVVLYWTGANGVTYIEKAETVSGKVTGTDSNNGISVGGKKYYESTLTGETATLSSWTDFTNSYTLYLDNAGCVVKHTQDTEDTSANYAVVTKIAFVTGAGVNGSNYAEAELLFLDGTTEVVKVSKIDGTAPTSGSANMATAKVDPAIANNATVYADRFYHYTVNALGGYELSTTAPSGAAFASLASSAIVSKAAKYDGTNIGNSNTVFVYATGTDPYTKYTIYTGINNVPSTVAAPSNGGKVAIVNTTAGVAKYVFVRVASSGTSATSVDYVYVRSAGYETEYNAETRATSYLKSVFLNGEATTIKVVSADANAAVGLYKVDAINNGEYDLNSTHGLTSKVGIKSNSGNTLVTVDGTPIVYNESTQVFYIDPVTGVLTEMTADSIAVTSLDTLNYKLSATNVATVIYVMKGAIAPTTVVLAGGTDPATVSGDGDLTAGAGAITGWTTGKNAKVTVTDTLPTGVTRAITVNGAAYTSAADIALSVGTFTVKVVYNDTNAGVVYTYTYTFTVEAAAE